MLNARILVPPKKVSNSLVKNFETPPSEKFLLKKGSLDTKAFYRWIIFFIDLLNKFTFIACLFPHFIFFFSTFLLLTFLPPPSCWHNTDIIPPPYRASADMWMTPNEPVPVWSPLCHNGSVPELVCTIMQLDATVFAMNISVQVQTLLSSSMYTFVWWFIMMLILQFKKKEKNRKVLMKLNLIQVFYIIIFVQQQPLSKVKRDLSRALLLTLQLVVYKQYFVNCTFF